MTKRSLELSLRGVVLFVLGIIAISLETGCGDPNAVGKMDLYPVKGAVLLADGKPLTSGHVVFVSTNQPISVEGVISSDGTFALNSGTSGSGAPAGEYKVRVDVDLTKQPQSKGKPPTRSGPLPFPAKYTDEDASGLTASVKAGDNDLPPFKLTK